MEKHKAYLDEINEQMTNYAKFEFGNKIELDSKVELDDIVLKLANNVNLLGDRLKSKVDELTKLNSELLQQKNFIKSIMELIPSYVFVRDNHTKEITYSNKCASSGEQHPCLVQIVEGENACNLCASGSDKKLLNTTRYVGKAGDTEIKVESKGGEINWYQLTKRSLYNEILNYSATIYSLSDITNLKVNELNLIKKEEIISGSLREKALLLQEVHHRVKNNLQIIYGLLSMQANTTQSDEVKHHLSEIQNRIYSISLIHEELYQSENFLTIDVSSYCKKLCNTIGTLSKSQHDVKFIYHLQPGIKINIERATPLGLYINEVICNAFKHAFKNSKAGTIQVDLSQDAEFMRLVIKDDGPGLPFGKEQFFGSSSLGSRLIKGLSQQLKGNLEVDGNSGCAISLTIPTLQRQKQRQPAYAT